MIRERLARFARSPIRTKTHLWGIIHDWRMRGPFWPESWWECPMSCHCLYVRQLCAQAVMAGNRPAHAHIKGGWPGPDTIHNGGHIQKKKLSGTNARAFRMRYSAFTENNGILHLSAHAYDQRYIYVYGTVRSLWLDTRIRFVRERFRGPDAIFKHAFALDTHFLLSGQSANTSASLSCIL